MPEAKQVRLRYGIDGDDDTPPDDPPPGEGTPPKDPDPPADGGSGIVLSLEGSDSPSGGDDFHAEEYVTNPIGGKATNCNGKGIPDFRRFLFFFRQFPLSA